MCSPKNVGILAVSGMESEVILFRIIFIAENRMSPSKAILAHELDAT